MIQWLQSIVLISLFLLGSNKPICADSIIISGSWDHSTFGDIHHYQLISAPGIGWDQAMANTTSSYPDYHLATITSQEEMSIIENLLSGITEQYWIGGYQDSTETTPDSGWHWLTNEPWNYTNWAPTEPNDWSHLPGNPSILHNEQHLTIFRWSIYDAWLWNDEGYSNSLANGWVSGYLVEADPADPVPEPATLLLLGIGLFSLAGLLRKVRR